MARRRDIDRLTELEELFADLWQVPRFAAGTRLVHRPQIDVVRSEEPAELTVVVEIPGADSDSIRVVLDGRRLVVAGDRPRPRTPEQVWYRSEIEYESTPAPLDLVEIPRELAVLPLRETVVFPESMTPLAIGQERSIKLVDDAVGGDRMLALLTTRDSDNEQPGFEDLYEVGTAAVIHKMIRVPDGTLRILVQGLRRVQLEKPVQVDPYLIGRFVEIPDVLEETREVEALTRNVQALFARIIALVPYLPEELGLAAANVEDPSALCHLVASTLRLKTEEKQQLLEEVDVEKRLRELSAILSRELEVFELGTRIQSQVQSEMEKGQREFFLRQQLKAIQDELGESDPERAEIEELRERLHSIALPEDVHKAADRELSRLERLPPAAAEHGVIRTYLEWVITP